MSVRRWSIIPGMWYTNLGGIAWSDDHGQTWTKDQHARWDNLFGIGRFQVATMVPQGDHVYMFGTPPTGASAPSDWPASPPPRTS